MLKETLITNIVLKHAQGLFRLAALLKETVLDESTLQNYRERVCQAFSDFERKAMASNGDNYTVMQAKYGLTAYIDEVVSRSDWAGRADWMSKPLQLQYFNEHTAGEGFFDHLQRLREFGEQYIDVLELYYVCMQLGFQGRYRLYHPEQLLGVQADLRGQIEAVRGVSTNQLSSDIAAEHVFKKRFFQNISWLGWVGITMVVISIIYIGFSMVINSRANESIAKIEAIQSTIMRGEIYL